METLKLRDESIKLGQALKASGLLDSGMEAKHEVQSGHVKLNGKVETQRGKKLVDGDVIEYDGKQIKIEGC